MSTSAADPADLQTFVTAASAALKDLLTAQRRVVALERAFRSLPQVGLSDGGTGSAVQTYFYDAKELDRSVAAIRRAFLAADAEPGTHSLSDTTIGAALTAAGVGIPVGPPVTVDTSAIHGAAIDSGVSDDPVNTASGNFFEEEQDLVMPGRASAVGWRRTYSSRRKEAGALGRGWACWADSGLVLVHDVLHWTRPDGRTCTLPVPEAPTTATVPGDEGALVVDDHGYRLTVGEPAEQWRFDPAGHPVHVRGDRTEAVLAWEDDRLVRLEHPRSGRSVSIAWSGDGRISTVTTSDGRAVRYAYDAAGDLIAAELPGGGTRRYEVDSGMLLAVTDADDLLEVRNTYDDEGRVSTQLSRDGRLSRYVYRTGLQTVVAGEDGDGVNGYQHDRAGRLLALTTDDGTTLRKEWDAEGRMLSITARGGGCHLIEYDEDGNVIRRVSPDGSATTGGWDAQRRLVEVTDRTGRTTRYGYRDQLRTPVSVTDAAGTTALEVDDDDQVTRIVDPDGVAADFGWDADGELISVGTAAGRIELLRDTAGNVVGLDGPAGMTARWNVDAAGRVMRQTDPIGNTYAFDRSQAGRPLAVVDPNGGRYLAERATNGNVASVTDPLGSVLAFGYDSFGRTTALTAPDGRTFSFGYDGLSRLTSVTDPTGAAATRSYDADGHLSAITSPTGVQSRWGYDAQGLPAAVTQPLGDEAHNIFDAEGRLVRQIAIDGSSAEMTYDEVGRLASVVDAAGALLRLTWTAGGRLSELTTPAGARSAYAYDEAGRLVAIEWSTGTTEVFERDAFGRVLRYIVDDVLVEELGYDGAGNVIAATDAAGRMEVVRDPFGQPLTVRRPPGSLVSERDVRGALVAITDERGVRTDFRYDECGRRVAAIGPLGGEWQYSYDAVGRPRAMTDPLGRAQQVERNADGQIVARVEADGTGTRYWLADGSDVISAVAPAAQDAPVDVFDLDKRGRVAAAHGPHGRVDAVRTLSGDLLALNTPDGGLRWEHDADGDIVAVSVVGGAEARFTYDDSGAVIGLDGRPDLPPPEPDDLWTMSRDNAGQLIRAERADTGDGDIVLTWQWDAGGRLISEGGPRGSRSYRYDEAGQLVSCTDERGVTRFGYDGAGRRVEEVRDGLLVRYRWDARGRLVATERSEDGAEPTVTELAYDAFGMLRRVGEQTLICDPNALGAPVRVVDGDLIVATGGGVLRLGADGGRRPVPRVECDPWGLPVAPRDPSPAFGAGGELAVDGLLILGDRILDPATRAFLSPDPLDFLPGRPGVENAYCYAFNDPTRYLDPTGRRPVSEKDLHTYWQHKADGSLVSFGKAVAAHPWESLAVAGELALGTVLCATGVGATVGAGMLIGAGSTIAVGLVTGNFDPKTALIAGAVGGLAGFAGPLAGAMSIESSAGTVALGSGIGGLAEGGGNLATQALQGGPVNWREVGGATAGGVIGGGVGGGGGLIGERITGRFAATAATGGVNFVGGAGDAAANGLIGDGHTSVGAVLTGGSTGAVGGAIGDKVAAHSPAAYQPRHQAGEYAPRHATGPQHAGGVAEPYQGHEPNAVAPHQVGRHSVDGPRTVRYAHPQAHARAIGTSTGMVAAGAGGTDAGVKSGEDHSG